MIVDSIPQPSSVVIPIVAGIGNAIMAVPMVRQLKGGLPDSRVTIVARTEAMAEVFRRVAEVDEVRVTGTGAPGVWRNILPTGRRRPDVYLIPFPSNRWQYAILALAGGARRRILHRYPVGYLRALGFVPADRIHAVRGVHDVVQNLNLLTLLGIEPDRSDRPQFAVRPDDRERAAALLREIGLAPQTRPIAIHPGSARTVLARAKRWPTESYARLIGALHREYGRPMLLLEGPDEAGVGEQILGTDAAGAAGAEVAVLRLNGGLGDAAAVLERSILYVGSDSGLGHLAAAVGTAPVTLFAPGDPDRVCPFGYRHLVVQPEGCSCAPCFEYPWRSPYPKMRCREPMCIDLITVESVMSVMRRAMSTAGLSPRQSAGLGSMLQ